MNKTKQAIAVIITSECLKKPDTFTTTLSALMLNDLFSLMGDDWNITKVEEEKPHMKEAISDVALLLSSCIIEHRHAKIILQKAWDTDQYSWDIGWYLSDSKILEEKSGNELDEIILAILKDNEKVVEDIKGGKKKAVGSLIGKVMKISQGKANPKEISDRIIELIGV